MIDAERSETGTGDGAAAGDVGGSDTERAEEMMEKVGERVGDWASRALARAREEAEDIWAEAQAVRRGDGS
jgi:hypothetical protein